MAKKKLSPAKNWRDWKDGVNGSHGGINPGGGVPSKPKSSPVVIGASKTCTTKRSK